MQRPLCRCWRHRCGDATSEVEFLRPLRAQLEAPGVLEVCVNRPGQLMVETEDGWRALDAPNLTLERCLSLATAVATYAGRHAEFFRLAVQRHQTIVVSGKTGSGKTTFMKGSSRKSRIAGV